METVKRFKDTLKKDRPPDLTSDSLLALWYDAKGAWHEAHELVQESQSHEAAWVHAYLHRKEGDLWNADFWYRRAGKSRYDGPLDEEWELISASLLKRANGMFG